MRFHLAGFLAVAAALLPSCQSPSGTDAGADEVRPNWHQDVAPLVAEHCRSCHREGGVGPFSLESYESAEPFADSMVEAVESRIMPPWGAETTEECEPPAPFLHDISLTPEDIELLADWRDAGAPEGDPDDAAELPDPPSLDLDDPDAVIEADAPFVVGGENDLWVCFSLDPELDQDVWLTGVQVLPQNPRVFHHAFVAVDPEAQSDELKNQFGWYPCFLTPQLDFFWTAGAYLPGTPPTVPPEGVGILLPQDSRLVLSVHYHPTGVDNELDQSAVALRWQDTPTDYLGNIAVVGNHPAQLPDGTGLQPGPNDPPEGPAFTIPVGAKAHTETMVDEMVPEYPTAHVYSVGTHMHFAGTGMRIELEKAGAERGCLLETPRWDPDWQRLYEYDLPFDDLPRLSAGDRLWLTCAYDNSDDNQNLREARQAAGVDSLEDIVLGEGALDEMCLGMFGVAWPRP